MHAHSWVFVITSYHSPFIQFSPAYSGAALTFQILGLDVLVPPDEHTLRPGRKEVQISNENVAPSVQKVA